MVEFGVPGTAADVKAVAPRLQEASIVYCLKLDEWLVGQPQWTME